MKSAGLTQIRCDDFTEFLEFLDAVSSDKMLEKVRSDLMNNLSAKNEMLLRDISNEGLELAPVTVFYGKKRPGDNHFMASKDRIAGLKSIDDARHKIHQFGVEPLSEEELLAVALDLDPDTCTKILHHYGGKALLKEKERDKIAQLLKMDEVKTINLLAIFELGRRQFQRSKESLIQINSPESAFDFLKDMKSLKREHLRGLYLNPQGLVVADEVLAIGSLSKALVSPREIITPALEYNASGIILAHNHLSGIPEPSAEDVEMTLQIEKAMDLMKIDLWDHIIIAEDSYYSFNEAGRLKIANKNIAFKAKH
jgi:DNA repair protein RadC